MGCQQPMVGRAEMPTESWSKSSSLLMGCTRLMSGSSEPGKGSVDMVTKSLMRP